MARAKIRRFSPGLVAIGYTVWIPALLLVLGVTGCAMLMTRSSANTMHELLEKDRARLVTELQAIDGMPEAVVEEARSTGHLKPETISALPERPRRQAERLTGLHGAGITGAAVGTGAVTAVSGCGVVLAYVAGIPLFIIGLVLTMRRSVWKCQACGSIAERA